MIVSFDFNIARGSRLLEAQPLQALFVVAATVGDLLAFDLAAEQHFFICFAGVGYGGGSLRQGPNRVYAQECQQKESVHSSG